MRQITSSLISKILIPHLLRGAIVVQTGSGQKFLTRIESYCYFREGDRVSTFYLSAPTRKTVFVDQVNPADVFFPDEYDIKSQSPIEQILLTDQDNRFYYLSRNDSILASMV